MDRIRLGSSVVDEKQVNHCADGSHCAKRGIERMDALFLISNKGGPRHCTTSTNRADT